MNHSHATQVTTQPTVVVVRQITVTEDPLTPEQVIQAKADAAQFVKDTAVYKANIKSGKWHEFKNGE